MVVSAYGQDGHNAVLHVEEEQDLDQGHALNPRLRMGDEIVVGWEIELRLRTAIATYVHQVWFD